MPRYLTQPEHKIDTMATPASRIFVLYIDTPAAASRATSSASQKALDEVAKRGCSGFLILPASSYTDTKKSDLMTLLGVDVNAKTCMMPLFGFPKLPVAFISDSADACETASSLGLEDVQNSQETESSEALSSRILSLLRQQDPKAKQMVFFHLCSNRPDHWIDDVVASLVSADDSDCFVSVVQAASHPHIVDPAAAAHPLRPRQSLEQHDGQYSAALAPPPRRLLCSSHHADCTRCDRVQTFTEDDIEASNAYGAMDARIFMKEMAFRLGFAPKYGA